MKMNEDGFLYVEETKMEFCPDCGSELTSGGCLKCNANKVYTYPPIKKIPFKCPVCDGTGLVSRPPHIAGDVTSWTDNSTDPHPCKACNGTGIVWGSTK